VSNDIYARLRELAAEADARPSVMRPVLLRVLTDLFALNPAHRPEDIHLYAEMAGALIGDADEASLVQVARKLAATPDAPESVLLLIRERGGAAAQELLRCDPHVEWRELRRLAASGPAAAACAIAARADLDRDLTRILSHRIEGEIAVALAGNAAAPLGQEDLRHLTARGRRDPALARALLDRGALSLEHLPLFLAAHAEERAQLLRLVRVASLAQTGRPDAGAPLDDASQLRLEADALRLKRSAFALTLAEMLDCDPACGRRLVEEESGEAMTLAFIALGLPKQVATRIFLAAFPKIALTREALDHDLALFDTLPPRDARRIVASFTGAVATTAASRARPPRPAAPGELAPARERSGPARREDLAG
jgi:uncharacterized protein (DUF2336 family)